MMSRDEAREEGDFILTRCDDCDKPFFSDGPRLCESCRKAISTVGKHYEDEHGNDDKLDWDDLLNKV